MIFESVEKVRINIENGTIAVEGWNESYVKVEYTATGEGDIITKNEGERTYYRDSEEDFSSCLRTLQKAK